MRRTYICGDVHLSGEDTAFLAWLDDLAKRPPGHLVILGDLFAFWTETSARVRAFAPLFAACRRLRVQGWHLDFIRGNREFTAGMRLRTALGATIHWPRLDVTVAGRRIRIVHGDRLCHDRLYHFTAALLRGFWLHGLSYAVIDPLQDLAALGMRALSRNGAQTMTAPSRPASRQRFLDPRRIEAAARGADILIAGHIHRRLHCWVRGIELALVGAWDADGGSWIEIDEAGQAVARACGGGR